MIYDFFRVTGAHDTVLDHANLFTITLRNDDVQDFDTRWDEILLSVTKIPSDDLLESLPDYQKLKTMVKRSIDQKLRLRNFYARNERVETAAAVTNRRGQRGVERGQRERHQWKANGQCSRGRQV